MSNVTETEIQGYNAAAEAVPKEALLGALIWFTITDADVHYERARKDLKDLGLNPNFLRPIRPVDAFRLACNELKQSFPMNDGVKLNIMVRSVGQDNDASYRNVVCERVITNGKRKLTYDPSAEVIYERGKRDQDGHTVGDNLMIHRHSPPSLDKAMTDDQRAWLKGALDRLPHRFEHLRDHLSSHKIRNSVREYLYSLGAICVKESGGVYFVPQKNRAPLEALSSWVTSIGSFFHTTPLLDLVNQRKMLAQAWEDEAQREVERLREQVREILEDPNRSIQEATFDDLGTRAAELFAKNNDVADMLDIRSDVTRRQIGALKNEVLLLTERISYKDKS